MKKKNKTLLLVLSASGGPCTNRALLSEIFMSPLLCSTDSTARTKTNVRMFLSFPHDLFLARTYSLQCTPREVRLAGGIQTDERRVLSSLPFFLNKRAMKVILLFGGTYFNT